MDERKHTAIGPETRKVLLALYAAIDALGGSFTPEEEVEGGYADGFTYGVLSALCEVSKLLAPESEFDEAWVEEGWKRLSDALAKAEGR